ncbi:hypothetical protein D9613_000870 [Agrocybe pediades]|uniref:BZIP domain-containing protein n=1 Tax=Agrocybe pediades TaxID=84607 RepID=A0A8H4R235_9AGAR|nr:hypothetical protein D9613_000870 [Agrocybe pediades]
MPKANQPDLALTMSQIIASDALSSPIDPAWEQQHPLYSPTQDSFPYPAYYPSPPHSDGESPLPPSSMLKMRSTSDPDFCLPTHQVFDFPEVARPPTPPSRSSSLLMMDTKEHLRTARATENDSDTMSSCGSKRSASPAPSAPKKRAVGERISSKDFIPPDVSGLSKREARLVKNRAAAFLSRQRKREEFECMEVRVAELEQENARLLALTQNGNAGSAPHTTQPVELVSEVEALKAQLAAARERERSLSAQLASKSVSQDSQVKVEAMDSQFSLSSPPRINISTSSVPSASASKSGASLGLMVLLCALPTLLSMRMQSTAPTSFSIPNPFQTSASSYDYNSFVPSDYDWSRTGGSMMDLDGHAHHTRPQKLEFIGSDSTELGGLGDLDISFDTVPSDDGKIRVRIHPPSSNPSSRSVSPGLASSSGSSNYDMMKADMSPISPLSSSSLAMWSGGEENSNSMQHQASFSSQFSSFTTSSDSDPFLGVPPSNNDFSHPFAADGTIKYGNIDSLMSNSAGLDFGQLSEFDVGSEFSIPDSSSTAGGRRRVRIALKSMPQAGGEGGEWEVQIC